MAELKTQANDGDVQQLLTAVAEETRRKDCQEILEMMAAATGADPVQWGTSIIGFGSSHYRYASGREGDWFQVGFAPRKQNITLYLMSGFVQHAELLGKLGKFSTGTSCLYIKRLSDVDRGVLDDLIRSSVQQADAASTR